MANRTQNMTLRQGLEQKHKSGRSNLLLAIILTVVNIVLLFTGSETMLLFSISVPYYAVIFGVIFEEQAMIIIAAVILAVYFLCWLLSKKRVGWLIAALVLIILDTLALIGFYVLAEEISGILDLVFHAMIIYYLAVGISSAKKLKNLPPEESVALDPEVPVANSVPLRRIEEDEKCRILLESTYGTYRVVYRRVKKTNQLVINDYIYDEITFGIEPDHSLSARIDGQEFTVGYRAQGSTSYFLVDGKEIAKKLRLY